MKTVLSVKQARTIIPSLIACGTFMEVSWVTGVHHIDGYYNVGNYVTRESAGDWTNHPQYSGSQQYERPIGTDVTEWVLSNLPLIDINVTVYHNTKR